MRRKGEGEKNPRQGSIRRGSLKPESCRVSAVIPAAPRAVYDAWLSGAGHSAMTGSPAQAASRVGAAFTAWDGYISGKNLDLDPPSRIVQSWRTTEFPAGAPDSRLEIVLEEAPGGTKVTIVHTGIPPGQASSYRKGWLEFYFAPMKEYFSGKG